MIGRFWFAIQRAQSMLWERWVSSSNWLYHFQRSCQRRQRASKIATLALGMVFKSDRASATAASGVTPLTLFPKALEASPRETDRYNGVLCMWYTSIMATRAAHICSRHLIILRD